MIFEVENNDFCCFSVCVCVCPFKIWIQIVYTLSYADIADIYERQSGQYFKWVNMLDESSVVLRDKKQIIRMKF